jgi:hypothetical protein
MKNPFEKKSVPPLQVDDDIPIYVERPPSPEIQEMLEYAEELRKRLTEIEDSAGERAAQEREFITEQLSRLDELEGTEIII